MTRAAFTLMELLMVVIIVGILATMALPGFARSTERARQRQAWDMLQTIYAGEQVYFSVNNKYTAAWTSIYMDNPSTASATYTISVIAGPPPAFTATAMRTGGDCAGKTMTMNETRTRGGTGWAACPMPL